MTRRGHAAAIVIVVAATTVCFVPVLRNGFVNWDDPDVLLRNTHLGGSDAIAWAFSTTHMSHYQPLSWLAWSAVKATFGLDAVAFHALSLLGHVVNAGLVYLACARLCALAGMEPRRSSLVAAMSSLLWAVHPVRVEPVAWASALPYVLSLSALLVSLLCYLQSHAPGVIARRTWRLLSIGSYAVSLLTRATAVGWPFVLLVLDAYPLRRHTGSMEAAGARWTRLALEKAPFFMLAIAAGIAESRARELATLEEVGLGARLTMALTAPFVYVVRTLFPLRLSPLDPLPIAPTTDWTALLLGLAGLAATSAAVWRARARFPVLLAAWATFLVLLAPVAGMTPSGQQATADRYMYVPGILVALLLSMALVRIGRSRHLAIPGLTIAAIGVAALGVATWRQLSWWHDSVALWTRAAEIDPRNDIATYNLAVALAEIKREEEAIARYEQTLRLVPDHDAARHNLMFIQAGRAEREGGRLAEAGRLEEAIVEYGRALTLDPARRHARSARAIALVQLGRFADAVDDLRAAFEAQPDDAAVANALAFSMMQTGQTREAVSVLERALARRHGDVEIMHNLARLLATTADAAVRDGERAVRLALEVRTRSGGGDPRVLDTLAAAYAASGQPQLAHATAAEAVALARRLGDVVMADAIASHARQFRR